MDSLSDASRLCGRGEELAKIGALMPLPALIEILPVDKPIQAEVTVPGSKSITNRALILAALGEGETALQGALWSEDTQLMVEALLKLGFEVKIEQDSQEFCNRTIRVKGLGGTIPNRGSPESPVELFVGNAGTAARFLAALVCLGSGVFRLRGVSRMHERPQAALFAALRELGYRIDTLNERLPALIYGSGPRRAGCRVSIEESSQFASALILCSSKGGWSIEVTGENAVEAPYLKLTEKLVASFPPKGGSIQIEPDASSGSYFWGAHWLVSTRRALSGRQASPDAVPSGRSLRSHGELGTSWVRVSRWPSSYWQVDQRFPETLPSSPLLPFPGVISREKSLGDSIMTAIVLAPLSVAPVRFTDLHRLRVQECERVEALRRELTRCGASVNEEGDVLTIFPGELHGAEIETYEDHRIAMCFAILGLAVPGIKIHNPSCVKKTFPNFFQKLAANPPEGLGAIILDGKNGDRLAVHELFAG